MAARDNPEALSMETSEEEGSEAESLDLNAKIQGTEKVDSPGVAALGKQLQATQVTQRKGPDRKAKSPDKEALGIAPGKAVTTSSLPVPKVRTVKGTVKLVGKQPKPGGSGSASAGKVVRTPAGRLTGGMSKLGQRKQGREKPTVAAPPPTGRQRPDCGRGRGQTPEATN